MRPNPEDEMPNVVLDSLLHPVLNRPTAAARCPATAPHANCISAQPSRGTAPAAHRPCVVPARPADPAHVTAHLRPYTSPQVTSKGIGQGNSSFPAKVRDDPSWIREKGNGESETQDESSDEERGWRSHERRAQEET